MASWQVGQFLDMPRLYPPVYELIAGSPNDCSAFLDVNRINRTVAMAMTSEDVILLRSKPPSARGLVNRSPSVAPNGRVKINAAQKRKVREIGVKRQSA